MKFSSYTDEKKIIQAARVQTLPTYRTRQGVFVGRRCRNASDKESRNVWWETLYGFPAVMHYSFILNLNEWELSSYSLSSFSSFEPCYIACGPLMTSLQLLNLQRYKLSVCGSSPRKKHKRCTLFVSLEVWIQIHIPLIAIATTNVNETNIIQIWF